MSSCFDESLIKLIAVRSRCEGAAELGRNFSKRGAPRPESSPRRQACRGQKVNVTIAQAKSGKGEVAYCIEDLILSGHTHGRKPHQRVKDDFASSELHEREFSHDDGVSQGRSGLEQHRQRRLAAPQVITPDRCIYEDHGRV